MAFTFLILAFAEARTFGVTVNGLPLDLIITLNSSMVETSCSLISFTCTASCGLANASFAFSLLPINSEKISRSPGASNSKFRTVSSAKRVNRAPAASVRRAAAVVVTLRMSFDTGVGTDQEDHDVEPETEEQVNKFHVLHEAEVRAGCHVYLRQRG